MKLNFWVSVAIYLLGFFVLSNLLGLTLGTVLSFALFWLLAQITELDSDSGGSGGSAGWSADLIPNDSPAAL